VIKKEGEGREGVHSSHRNGNSIKKVTGYYNPKTRMRYHKGKNEDDKDEDRSLRKVLKARGKSHR